MGGLLALALAQRRQGDLAGLVLMATPWDFHADNAPQGRLAAASLPLLAPLLEIAGELPVDLLQTLFASLDPDRKSTRLNPVTNAHLVFRLLLEKKTKNTHAPRQKQHL